MKSGWMPWALAGMTGIALGGGYGSYSGRAEAQAVRIEMHAEIEKLEDRLKETEDAFAANQLAIVVGITELQVDVRYIREKIDANAR